VAGNLDLPSRGAAGLRCTDSSPMLGLRKRGDGQATRNTKSKSRAKGRREEESKARLSATPGGQHCVVSSQTYASLSVPAHVRNPRWRSRLFVRTGRGSQSRAKSGRKQPCACEPRRHRQASCVAPPPAESGCPTGACWSDAKAVGMVGSPSATQSGGGSSSFDDSVQVGPGPRNTDQAQKTERDIETNPRSGQGTAMRFNRWRPSGALHGARPDVHECWAGNSPASGGIRERLFPAQEGRF